MITKTLLESHVQEAGSNTNKLYRALVETSPDAIVLLGPDGVIRLVNAQASKLHGFGSAEAMVGISIYDLIIPDEHTQASEHMRHAVRFGSMKNLEHQLRRTDGTIFPAELSISVVTEDNGEPDVFITVVRDISDRKAVEQKISRLVNELQYVNAELERAYDTTLEGWTGVLDLRDKETEGHSRRVCDATVELARMLGVPEDDLIHIRRGALLHDIGKMGIPDGILLKPSTLTEEEWRIMRMHPVYAYELLSHIPFLQKATVIPHSHHERWDGTGYPRGLKGEDIPLAARIFAVIDVWEALRSDRPYRAAWPEQKVLAYIRSQAGTHFDPKVVEQFLKMDTSCYRRQRTTPLEDMMEIIERAQARDTKDLLTAQLREQGLA